jgi:hypothetical protein
MMAKIKPASRAKMKASTFALPSERKYPIPDKSHAQNALARSSGKPEQATVRRAVLKKYPSLKKK